MVASKSALNELINKKMSENSRKTGRVFRKNLRACGSRLIKEVRGKGLMNALEIYDELSVDLNEICREMAKNGVLAQPVGGHVIRFLPPLCITENQVTEVTDAVAKTLRAVEENM